MTTKDGYLWTPDQGLNTGIPCVGAVRPSQNFDGANCPVVDVIVIGAGYCGLTAARDMCLAGLKVLLLEGRDRIGGRSWSSDIGGYPFEMGGTWIYWGQANVWREIMRYQMHDEIEISQDFREGINQYVQASSHKTQRFSHDEESAIMDSGLRKLFNVDGQLGKRVLPFPHSAEFTSEAVALDQMTAADRISDIEDSLTLNERLGIEAWILVCSGGTLETVSFLELLHWWALSGYSYEGCVNHLARYKFKHGQSAFARKFFEEAVATNNLSYAFNSAVSSVDDTGSLVTVKTRDGQRYKAKRIISTVPLNVLSSVTFNPPLSGGRKTAACVGHNNHIVKVHAEVGDRNLRSYTGISYPQNELFVAFGDGKTPAGNTHIVSFGGQHRHFHPEEDIQVTIKALGSLIPMDIKKIVFHNWSKDEFAKGAWFFPGPGLLSKHLADMRSKQRNIYFSNSDWALGWRSFIDGAIEEGTRAALFVRNDLMKSYSNATSV
ncbi:flavin monoamine oxidase family protein [Aspergillus fijiensis CBS 313.89]|uniref:Amine oxidase n=1 Tax=Aspergillus fijiensis CBS 313.89 TaxID=1448319 RepID=A0A8G1RW18_9EURO|nr:amine oxidase [Aspergillus fijiensis CBS 313.89]RAK79949.1 amine oxidase [Aspergillus fijiensis CBS 313.89]